MPRTNRSRSSSFFETKKCRRRKTLCTRATCPPGSRHCRQSNVFVARDVFPGRRHTTPHLCFFDSLWEQRRQGFDDSNGISPCQVCCLSYEFGPTYDIPTPCSNNGSIRPWCEHGRSRIFDSTLGLALVLSHLGSRGSSNPIQIKFGETASLPSWCRQKSAFSRFRSWNPMQMLPCVQCSKT